MPKDVMEKNKRKMLRALPKKKFISAGQINHRCNIHYYSVVKYLKELEENGKVECFITVTNDKYYRLKD